MFFFLPGKKAGNPAAKTKEYGYRNTYTDNSKKLYLVGFVPVSFIFYAIDTAAILDHCTGGNMYLWDIEE